MRENTRAWRLMRWLTAWSGTITRGQYLAAGTVLLLIKYGIDRQITSSYGQLWHIWNYFVPTGESTLLHTANIHMYLVLWAVALPFFWVGVALTIRRLRSAGRKPTWAFLFFAPAVNLLFFLTLCFLPARQVTTGDSGVDSCTPGPSAALGVLLSVALGFALVLLSVSGLARYGSGLFLGVPFAVGFISAAMLNHRRPHSRGDTLTAAVFATLLLGLLLLGVGYEGALCLLMALPLAIPLALAGASLAWHICQQRETPPSPTIAAWVLILPLVMLGEQAINPRPPLLAVSTAVEINASPEEVWKHVVSFTRLAPPREALFQTGIAYPTSAVIYGSGVGAVRHCKFSTGEFVEPITTWDEGRLLAFNVTAQPMSMRELSFTDITPPHLERNYMRSKKGQFRFIALPGGRTRLEGTTWYQNYFWPQTYWRMWSDYIVHKIHMRVLLHVKAEAEQAARPSQFGLSAGMSATESQR